MYDMTAEYDYDNAMAPVATLADAHAHWHSIHGKYAVCDLDCGASEAFMDEGFDAFEGNIKCGHCGQHNVNVEHVRNCAANYYALRG